MSEFVCEVLDDRHERSGFSCGVEPLDRYLAQQAGQDQRRRAAQVYVLCPAGEPTRIAGYFTLSAASVRLKDLASDAARKLPRYPNVPAILIGRLAVSIERQRQGIGGLSLAEALKRCARLSEELGAAVVVMDAKDERAARFYLRHGFQRIAGVNDRLFLPMAGIKVLV